MLLLLVTLTQVYGQKEASNWYFGWHAGLKFDSTSVKAVKDGKTNYWLGFGSSISDENGNLFFYTDGDTTYDRHHHRMPNGYGLNGKYHSETVVVPNPSSNTIYYVFTIGLDDFGDHSAFISYSTVDLTLNGGLGDVTEKRHVLFSPTTKLLAAILHANGRDIWVVAHEWNTNRFLSYLVTAAGVSETPVVSAIGSVHWEVGIEKQMHFSPDGDKIAVTSSTLPVVNSLEVFNFSVVSGKVSNLIFSVSDRTDPLNFRHLKGVEFSPDGKFLYASNSDNSGPARIFQFDLSSGSQASILNSAVALPSPLSVAEACMQLGPDGKIYIAHGSGIVSLTLSWINYPNKKGLACGYEESKVDLAGASGMCLYLPIFVENYVTPPPSFTTSPLCALDSTIFFPSSLGYYDSLKWDFGDPESGASNRSKIKQARHKFSANGSHRVTLTTYFDGQPRRKAAQQITINQMPRIELGKDTTICKGNSVLLSVPNGFQQRWSTGETGPSIGVTKQGVYKVTLTNGQCTISDSIKVIVLDQPIINLPANLIACAKSQLLDSNNPTFTVLWSTGANTDKIAVNETGTYSVRVTNGICVATDTVFVRMAGISDLTVWANKDTVGYNAEIVFDARASDIEQWRWNFGDDITSTEQSTTHVYQKEGNYKATLAATNSYGCKDSTSVKIIVKPVLNIPNVFTPNDDGKNDSFIIEYNGDKEFNLVIYNRWGQQVYFSKGKQNQWNGGSEEAGTFYYLVTIGSERFKGWVHLIR